MPETYITRSSAIAARMLAGEMMVMNSMDSTFFTLNEVATAIWQAADGRTPLREIVRNQVCEQFDIEPAQATSIPHRITPDGARTPGTRRGRRGVLKRATQCADSPDSR